jgi:hypothetical protein
MRTIYFAAVPDTPSLLPAVFRPLNRYIEGVLITDSGWMLGSTPDRRTLVEYVTIISANSLALPGILLWNWTIYDLVALYWGESGIIILIALLAIMLFGTESEQATGQSFVPSRNALKNRAELTAGVALVFCFFWLIHGAFIGAIRKEFPFATVALDVKLAAVSSVLAVLAVSHVVRVCLTLSRLAQWQTIGSQRVQSIFDRTVKLQVGLLSTMFVTLAVGFPRPLLVVVVLGKVLYDLWVE